MCFWRTLIAVIYVWLGRLLSVFWLMICAWFVCGHDSLFAFWGQCTWYVCRYGRLHGVCCDKLQCRWLVWVWLVTDGTLAYFWYRFSCVSMAGYLICFDILSVRIISVRTYRLLAEQGGGQGGLSGTTALWPWLAVLPKLLERRFAAVLTQV